MTDCHRTPSSNTELEEAVADHLQPHISEQIAVEHSKSEEFVDWENLTLLSKTDLIETLYVHRQKITVHPKGETKSRENEIARMEWARESNSSVVYFHWVWVKDGYRQQGVGSTIRQSVIDHYADVPGVSYIVTEAFSPSGKGLITSQEFKPLDEMPAHLDADLRGDWFAYTV